MKNDKSEIKRYTIALPKEQFKKVRIMAAERGCAVKMIFEEMLAEYLYKHE